MENKRIVILNTGGTLSSVMKENGLAPGLRTSDIQKEIRMVSRGIDLETQDLCSLDSANIFPEDWTNLAGKVAELRRECGGIVIIHGTDTMAYTSSMLSFMLRNIDIPVVLTGSQLSMVNPVADAMENLRCAVHMAASGAPGVFVAFNRKVMLGCRTSKVRSLSFDAFDSINYPDVARISSLGMKVNRGTLPVRQGVFRLCGTYSDKVFMLKLFPGMHRSVLRALADQGYRGIYIEAFGVGGMPFMKHDLIDEIADLCSRGITVLVGTQCRYEGSNLNVYETGRRALEAGVLQALDMTSESAVTKLMWVLGRTEDRQEIRDYFSVSLCNEVTLS